ncbi:coiled-coil domain-containing protein-domain-containing protein [Bisporella sp. PMI_857]|nr:coiled-coil domain-containing protein-domain-containing protein [Bisporella sp. PMI_857]
MPLIEESPILSQEDSASKERTERIRIKNRRKMYLDRHPSYFTSPDLELADPLLYDRCIRRFQSAAEREADGRSKGYSGVLEADLYRSEAKLAALKGKTTDGEPVQSSTSTMVPFVSYVRGEDGEVLPEDPDEIPKTKEDGFQRWKFEMTVKFLRGDDKDFDYKEVDESEEWDIIESQEAEEKWFDDEEPEWEDGIKSGETGIQDY